MTSHLRVPLVVEEPLTEGAAQLRVPLVISEPLTEGAANLRVPLVISEPLTEGAAHLRVAFVMVEALIEVPEEGELATDILPTLRGLSWSVHKKPNFNTQVRVATNNHKVTNSLTPYPIWEFEQTYDYLPDKVAGNTDFKTLVGFFLEMGGRFKAWLFKDPSDHAVTTGNMLRLTDFGAGGDGVTTEFLLARTLGGFVEPVGQLDTVAAHSVYVNGVLQVAGTDYVFAAPNQIVFTVAPGAGLTVTATFEFYFVCRFLDDAQDYENFAYGFWSLGKFAFESVLQ